MDLIRKVPLIARFLAAMICILHATNAESMLPGVVGDGVTDDTKALQAILDTPGCSGLSLSPGKTYLVSKLILPSARRFALLGNNATLKKTANDTSKFVLSSANFVKNNDSVESGLLITDLEINGGNAGEDCNGLVVYAWNSTFRNLDIHQCTGHGITMVSKGQDGMSVKGTAVNNVFSDLKLHHNNGHGLYIAHGGKTTDWYINGACWIYQNKGWGIVCEEAAGAQINGNLHFYNNAEGAVWVRSVSIGNIISGLYLEQGQTVRIDSGWRSAVISQCSFWGAKLSVDFGQRNGVYKTLPVSACTFFRTGTNESVIEHRGQSGEYLITVSGCVFDAAEPFLKTGNGTFMIHQSTISNQAVYIDRAKF